MLFVVAETYELESFTECFIHQWAHEDVPLR